MLSIPTGRGCLSDGHGYVLYESSTLGTGPLDNLQMNVDWLFIIIILYAVLILRI